MALAPPMVEVAVVFAGSIDTHIGGEGVDMREVTRPDQTGYMVQGTLSPSVPRLKVDSGCSDNSSRSEAGSH